MLVGKFPSVGRAQRAVRVGASVLAVAAGVARARENLRVSLRRWV